MFITKLSKNFNSNIVLIIDEVDKSCNNQLFLDFLGMLRNKYLLMKNKKDYTFHSVILVGVHDIKTLKLKLCPDSEAKYNSPWNIAANFKVDMSFNPEEIASMLLEFKEERSIDLDIKLMSEKLYFYTSGYPFLVSRLCQIIDEEDFSWTIQGLEKSVKYLVYESNTNFDDLIKNIENNSELYDFIQRIILDGEEISYIKTDNIISLGTLYGILNEENEICKIHNKIYELLLYNHMTMKKYRQKDSEEISNYNYKDNFIKNGTLDIEKLILKFQEFMKEQYSKKNKPFLERDGRLILLAFIKPIINGVGFDLKKYKYQKKRG